MTTFTDFVRLVGKPYMWVQRICGLNFLAKELHVRGCYNFYLFFYVSQYFETFLPIYLNLHCAWMLFTQMVYYSPLLQEVLPKSSVSLSHMEATIKAIRARILARLALQQQLTSLGKLG